MNEKIKALRQAHLVAWEAAEAESLLSALGQSDPGRAADALMAATEATQALAAAMTEKKDTLDIWEMGEDHTYAAWLQADKRICVQCGADVKDGPLVEHTCLRCYRANGFRPFKGGRQCLP